MSELVKYDAMCRAIDAAYEVDEVKDIRDKAKAWEVYSRQALNVEAERRACEIRLRAERKAGELLAAKEKAKGARGSGSNQHEVRSHEPSAPTLAELGITKDQSSDWQKLAKVPQEKFEAALTGPEKPTTAGIIAAAAPSPPKPYDENALWVSHRLLDFERNGILADDPKRVLGQMHDFRQDDTRRLAPLVIDWLQRMIAND